jgi:uncharacterized protein (TIGR02271 family)
MISKGDGRLGAALAGAALGAAGGALVGPAIEPEKAKQEAAPMEPSGTRERYEHQEPYDPSEMPVPPVDPRLAAGGAPPPRRQGRRPEGWGAAGTGRRPGVPIDRHPPAPLPDDVPPPLGAPGYVADGPFDSRGEQTQTVELREEELVAHKELREVGEIAIRTEVEELPGRLEVDAYREEVEVEHVPVDRAVSERVAPWEEDGVLVVPVYEERLVVVKRLVMREQLRIRRVGTTEKQLCEQTLRRERLIVEDPDHTGLIREQFPVEDVASASDADPRRAAARQQPEHEEGGLFDHLARKILG